ncbi:condensation domain-containing protein [Streptomyces sp. Wh19]|uniref:condensation domain-containing protein n=1 Tax=Streptomyces sp. Wh19 TaxID=3076629 RepID=UPI0029584C3D|nr:condensation domain-containing protein [Streptomyces sp. Wh19]MDV9194477.1 condensation domain-containing protein [Streptomyces sp. Wh19]
MRIFEIPAHFHGTRSGIRPMTWGQVKFSRLLEEKHPSELGLFNINREISIPQGARVETIVEAIVLAIERFEALRTRFNPGPDRLQILSSKGVLSITAIEIEGDEHESLNEYIDQWQRNYFGDEFSIRVSIAIERNSVRRLFLVYNHVAIDGTSAALVNAAIRDSIKGISVHSDSVSRSMQPFEIQEYEHSQLGRERSARAAEHWASTLRQIPATAFSPLAEGATRPAQDINGPQRMIRALYNSADLSQSQAKVAERLGVSPSSVIAAAFFSLISVLTSNNYATLQVLCSNRPRGELQESVSNLAQAAIALVDCSGATFDTLAKRVGGAALRAYRHGRYDPSMEDELIREVRSERGIYVTRDSCMFNYINVTSDFPVEEFESLGQVKWLSSRSRWTAPPMRFNVLSASSMVQLAIEADDAYLNRADVDLVLRGVERICAEAANRDIEISKIIDICNISPMIRSDEWIYRDRTYIDLRASRNLLEGVPGVESASLAVDESDGGDSKINCSVYVENERITASYVHAGIVDRLHSFPNGSAPTWYDVYLAAGNRGRLLDSGSGRGDTRPNPF